MVFVVDVAPCSTEPGSFEEEVGEDSEETPVATVVPPVFVEDGAVGFPSVVEGEADGVEWGSLASAWGSPLVEPDSTRGAGAVASERSSGAAAGLD